MSKKPVSDDAVTGKIKKGYNISFDVPGFTAKDMDRIRSLQIPGIEKISVKVNSDGPAVAVFKSPISWESHGPDKTFTWFDDMGGQELLVRTADQKLGDYFLEEVNKIKDRRDGLKSGGLSYGPTIGTDMSQLRQLVEYIPMPERLKKITKLKECIRLINTAQHTSDLITRAAVLFSGKKADQAKGELTDSIYQKIKEVITEQIKYLESMNEGTNGPACNVQPPEKVMTYSDHQAVFIKVLLSRIDALEEERRHGARKIDELKVRIERSFRDNQDDTRTIRINLDRAEETARTFKQLAHDRAIEIKGLEKTIQGLRSSITRLGGKVHPPRKRKKVNSPGN